MPPGTRNALAPPVQNTFAAPVTPMVGYYGMPVVSQDPAADAAFLRGMGRSALTNLVMGAALPGQLVHDASRSLRAGAPAGVYADLVEAARKFNPSAVPGAVANYLQETGRRFRSSPEEAGAVLGENLDVRNMFRRPKPVVAAAVGPYRPQPLPEFHRDNPGGDWLREEREYAASRGTKPSGALKNYGKTTASFKETVMLPVSVLADIPGEHLEQANVRLDSLNWLTNKMKKTGKLPTYKVGAKELEDVPLITVDQYGRPFVNEGNHRIMAAKKLGWDYLPVEIKYFNGGELESGPLHPQKIAELAAADPRNWLRPQKSLGIWDKSKYALDKFEQRGNDLVHVNTGQKVAGSTVITLKNGTPITLLQMTDKYGDEGVIAALTPSGERVGELSYVIGANGFHPDVHVEEPFRRQGLATSMYDLAEATGGVIPEYDVKGAVRTPMGEAFRKNRANRKK